MRVDLFLINYQLKIERSNSIVNFFQFEHLQIACRFSCVRETNICKYAYIAYFSTLYFTYWYSTPWKCPPEPFTYMQKYYCQSLVTYTRVSIEEGARVCLHITFLRVIQTWMFFAFRTSLCHISVKKCINFLLYEIRSLDGWCREIIKSYIRVY